ncbi:MAG: dTDP-4-dehydrorhamnose 3,5-epimerase [Salibacteraceae bacterium]
MKVMKELDMPGVFAIELFHAKDERGVFVKTFHLPTLEKHGLSGKFEESFYSVNKRGVIRGMHFQLPPFAHSKLIYCTRGRLIDVAVDLRVGSPTYGRWIDLELNENNHTAIYLPIGVAHGFAVLEDHTTMIYHTSTVHAPKHDAGIRYDSFGYDWPFEGIHSERDLSFPELSAFKSPFIYHEN